MFQVVEYESAVTARDAVFSELSKAGTAVAHRVCAFCGISDGHHATNGGPTCFRNLQRYRMN